MKTFENSFRLVEQAIVDHAFPSAALAIGRKNELYLKEACGYTTLFTPQKKANFETLYDMASLTKIFSATLITLRLIEEGRVCLGDTINRFFNDAPTDKKEITILELMTHTSGLPANVMLEDFNSNPKEVVKTILSLPLSVPRGMETIYSCSGFILLGKILEKICDKPLDTLMNNYVTEPLEMKSTTFRPQGDNIAATEYIKEMGHCITGVVHDENARFLSGIAANAGVFSTIDDCIKLAQMLANSGVAGGRHFLQEATLARAIVNFTPGKSHNRGLGFKLAGGESDYIGDLFSEHSFGHTGFTGTSLVVEPESGLFAVLLTNRIHPVRDNVKILRFRQVLHNVIKSDFGSL